MLNRDLIKLVGGTLLLGAVMLATLPACGETTGETSPLPTPTPTTTVATPTPATTVLAPTPTATPATDVSTPTPTLPDVGSSDPLVLGKLIFDKTAGNVGCAFCHGLDAKGNGPALVGAPYIRGKNEGDVRAAIAGGVPMMGFIKLTEEEYTAVAAYLQFLETQP
ncbi:MAG: cytochrome c [Chloroflexi bacterium]|nr:cytochrome c [Chloroflexota bacterium]